MKCSFVIFAALLTGLPLYAQTTSTFEEFGLIEGEFLNGSDLNGGFFSGNIFLPNTYDENYDSWVGWAISATTDTVTPGFLNTFSANTGSGVDGSSAYAIGYILFDSITLSFVNEATGNPARGFYITNSTYAWLSMRNGDAFAKKFGGESGDDPDFFLLTIEKFLNGEKGDEQVEFFLADYRFDDNSMDYIVKEWTWVDLSPLGRADSLVFKLSSSDNGIFGMNTPAFFCIDDVTTEDMATSTGDPAVRPTIAIYPNPATEAIIIDGDLELPLPYAIASAAGQILLSGILTEPRQTVNLGGLPQGLYHVILNHAGRPLATEIVLVR